MPCVLERAHALQRDRPPDVDVRDVTSIPSLTRNGRPSLSFFEPARGEQVDVVAGDRGDVAHGACDSTGAARAAAAPLRRRRTSPIDARRGGDCPRR